MAESPFSYPSDVEEEEEPEEPEEQQSAFTLDREEKEPERDSEVQQAARTPEDDSFKEEPCTRWWNRTISMRTAIVGALLLVVTYNVYTEITSMAFHYTIRTALSALSSQCRSAQPALFQHMVQCQGKHWSQCEDPDGLTWPWSCGVVSYVDYTITSLQRRLTQYQILLRS